MFQAASSQHEAEKTLQAALSRARKRGEKGGAAMGIMLPSSAHCRSAFFRAIKPL